MSVEQLIDQNTNGRMYSSDQNGFGESTGPDFEPALSPPIEQQQEAAADTSREAIDKKGRGKVAAALGAIALTILGSVMTATDKDTSSYTMTEQESKGAIIATSGITLGAGLGANALSNILERRRRSQKPTYYGPPPAATAPPNPHAPILVGTKRQ